MNVESLNALPPDDARAALLRCCGSRRWGDAMIARRPFASAEDVLRGLPFENDVRNAASVQQLPQQQPGRTGANNDDLSSHKRTR